MDLSHHEYHLGEVDMGNTDDKLQDKKDRYKVVEGRGMDGVRVD